MRKSRRTRDDLVGFLAESLQEARAEIAVLKREIRARDQYGHWLAQRVNYLETSRETA